LVSTNGLSDIMYCSFAYDGLLARFWSIFAIYPESARTTQAVKSSLPV